jgi:shikimate kinase
MNEPTNLILIGPMGAGKSTIGRKLAEHFGLEFYDLDHEIERRTGATVALIFELEGEAGFRKRESAVLAELADARGRVIATGGGSVLAPENRRLIRASGFVIYLRITLEQQLARLARDRKRPLLNAPDRRARLEALAAERDPLYAELADLTFPADEVSVAVAARRLAGVIERDGVPHRLKEHTA